MGEKAHCVVALLPIAQTHSSQCFLACLARSPLSELPAQRRERWHLDWTREGESKSVIGEEGGDVWGQQKGRRTADFGL